MAAITISYFTSVLLRWLKLSQTKSKGFQIRNLIETSSVRKARSPTWLLNHTGTGPGRVPEFNNQETSVLSPDLVLG